MATLPHHACFDIIGDIHGYADDLKALLQRLGYRKQSGAWRTPETDRRAIFVGDFVDRGPAIAETLDLVRALVEDGAAFAVLGNHEYNAIAYATEVEGRFLREHNKAHVHQHAVTLAQLGGDRVPIEWLDWFGALPPYLANDDLRIVHACWDPWAIGVFDEALQRHGGLTRDFMLEASLLDCGNPDLFWAVEWTLKGKELPLPEDCPAYHDKDGVTRRRIRTRWFAVPEAPTYRNMVFPPSSAVDLPDQPVPQRFLERVRLPDNAYPPDAPPVFFGHYWLTGDGRPQCPNVICLDHSVAKGGHLVACTWRRGEPVTAESFTASR